MATDPVNPQSTPYWYQTGKQLLNVDLKEQGNRYMGDVQFIRDMPQDLPFLREYYKETVLDGTTSYPLYIPPGVTKFRVSLQISAGTARVEYSISNIIDIVAGAGEWQIWAPGNANADASVILEDPITAIRAQSAGSDAIWEARSVIG